ncbi:MAG TPA: ParB/RepB/Spo0J family partition protein [Gemmataceae bacterium]|nr:ParB/RepB/Spo0J family partition protein [Gemmataceae bacterium]
MQSQMAVLLLTAMTLQPDPKEPRKVADTEDLRLELRLLGEDMKRRGVLVPLLVRRKGDVYMLIDGHRRRQAALLAGIDKLPCIVFDKDVTEAEIRETQLVTQLHSQALTPYEVYAGSKNWLSLHPESTAKTLAAAISRSEAYISMILSLDRCPHPVREAAAKGLIGLNDWYGFSRLPEQQQLELLTARLNGASSAEIKRLGKKTGQPAVRVARVKCQLPSGVCVTLAGEGDGLSLDDIVESLSELLKEAKKANDQGLDSKTWAAVLRDKAKAS